MLRFLARITFFLFAAIFLVFAILNRHAVMLHLPFSDHALVMPLFFVFALGMLFGICLAILIGIGPAITRYRSRRAVERRARSAEAALSRSRESEAAARRVAAQGAIDRAQTGMTSLSRSGTP